MNVNECLGTASRQWPILILLVALLLPIQSATAQRPGDAPKSGTRPSTQKAKKDRRKIRDRIQQGQSNPTRPGFGNVGSGSIAIPQRGGGGTPEQNPVTGKRGDQRDDRPGGLVGNMVLANVYRANDGGAYYVRKLENKVYIFGEHPGQHYAVAIDGNLSGNVISGKYWDLPKGSRTEQGTVSIRIDNNGQNLVVQNATGSFGINRLTPYAIQNDQLPGAKRKPGFYATSTGDLDGAWRTSGGNLYIREVGGKIIAWQESEFASGSKPTVAKIGIGTRDGSGKPVMSFVSLPKGQSITQGNATFVVDDAFHMRELGGSKWVREVLDVAKFEDEIVNLFANKCVGFGYAIAHEGTIVKSGGWGPRILPQDGVSLSFDGDTQKGTQSTTKTITAVAVMHLLSAKGISVNEKIFPYLPTGWARGPNTEQLTFAHLLNHKSGLVDYGDPDEYENLKHTIATGPINMNWIVPQFEYKNCNFALFRILIPYLDKPGDMHNFEDNGLSGATLNERCSERYRDYVRQHVLLPAGITNPQPTYTSLNQAWSYNYTNQAVAGYPVQPNQLYEMGAGGWVLSAKDYAKFLAAFDSGEIISMNIVDEMKSKRLGLYGINSNLGLAYYHGGSIGGNAGDSYGSGRGARAQSMIFPNKVQVFITINSANNIDPAESSGARRDALCDAFNNSLY